MSEEIESAVEAEAFIAPAQEQEAKELSNLSNKDIKWREKYKLTVAELEREKLEQEEESKRLLNEVTSKEQRAKMYEEKLVDAKLEAHAIAAGIQDTDLIKLIDKSKLVVNEDGSVAGLAEAVNEFKATKPHFFGSEKKLSSSTNAPVPQEQPVQRSSAFDLTDMEWNSFKRNMKGGLASLR